MKLYSRGDIECTRVGRGAAKSFLIQSPDRRAAPVVSIPLGTSRSPISHTQDQGSDQRCAPDPSAYQETDATSQTCVSTTTARAVAPTTCSPAARVLPRTNVTPAPRSNRQTGNNANSDFRDGEFIRALVHRRV